MRRDTIEMALACLLPLAFGLGLWLGGLIVERRAQPLLEACIELKRTAAVFVADVEEVADEKRLLLGGGPLLAGDERGLPTVHDYRAGAGGVPHGSPQGGGRE